MTRHRAGWVLLLVALTVTGLVACGGRRQIAASGDGTGCEIATDRRISIATGNTGGVYYVLGGAFAEAVSSATGGRLKATAAETGASVQNIQQLVAGNYQLAFALADTAADAVNGTGSFVGSPQPITALGALRTTNPVYDVATIPASTYPNATDTPTIVVPNLLVVPANLDDATACVLARTLFERKNDLVAVNPAAENITLQRARQTGPVPLHPGAEQALNTLGAPWTGRSNLPERS